MWTLAALRRSRSVALLLAHRFHGHHQLWTLAALRSSLNVALLLAHRFLHGHLHLWTLAAPRTSPSAVLLLAEWLLHRRLCCCHQPWRTRTTSLHVPYLSRALPGLQRSASWRCMWMNQRMSLKRMASCSRRTVVSFGTGACHVEVFCPVGCMWLGSLEWFHRCRDTACDEGGVPCTNAICSVSWQGHPASAELQPCFDGSVFNPPAGACSCSTWTSCPALSGQRLSCCLAG